MQRDAAQILAPFMSPDGLIVRCLEYAENNLEHIMDFTRLRALGSLFSMLNQCVRQIQAYNQQHGDFPMKVRDKRCSSIFLSFSIPA